VTDRSPNRCREILIFKILYGKKGNIYGRLKAVGMCTVNPMQWAALLRVKVYEQTRKELVIC